MKDNLKIFIIGLIVIIVVICVYFLIPSQDNNKITNMFKKVNDLQIFDQTIIRAEIKRKFANDMKAWKTSALNRKCEHLNIQKVHIKYPQLFINDYSILNAKDNQLIIIVNNDLRKIRTNSSDILVSTEFNGEYLLRNSNLYKIQED